MQIYILGYPIITIFNEFIIKIIVVVNFFFFFFFLIYKKEYL